ncbi:MAG: hypothetical protein WC959_11620 [Kiritimatiellales bacterium]
MKTFLGVGFGPIQTGIFLSGAFRGGFDRLVIADVDAALISAVRENGGAIQINTASNTAVTTETISGIEIYNPSIPADREKLISVAADADEIATALPGVAFFKTLDWMRAGFQMQPGRRRFVYTAENHNHAAEELEQITGTFSDTFFLNTVVGKMSCVFPADECRRRKIPALTPQADRGHLVEEFNKILIQFCPGIEQRSIQGLIDKPDLFPFEEAKLYGHNAVHFWIGLHAQRAGNQFMHEVAGNAEILIPARRAFIEESGAALCRKYSGVDELFTPDGFSAYADDLLSRMVNPSLTDRVDRVCRDMERKLGWNDRVIGTIRLVLNQGISPVLFAEGAAIAVEELFGRDVNKIHAGVETIWESWNDEAEAVWREIRLPLERMLK